MKFSFIIPVYKVEAYLDNCVQSILRQTYKDYEIILVDDGSPDNCPAICDQLASGDPRIKVFHKKNGGLSDARNYGLPYAEGEYVIFVDSDDYWDKDYSLDKIANILSENKRIDILFFNIFYYNDETGEKIHWPEYTIVAPATCGPIQALGSMEEQGCVPMSAWSKVIKRSLLIDNDILFEKGIYGEDIPWFISLMLHAKVITLINDYIYAYRQNVSTSITKSNKAKHVQDMKYIIESGCNYLNKQTVDDTLKDYLLSFLAYNYCILLSECNDVDGLARKELWSFLKKYKFLLSYQKHAKVKKVGKIASIIGIKPTAWILRCYIKYR